MTASFKRYWLGALALLLSLGIGLSSGVDAQAQSTKRQKTQAPTYRLPPATFSTGGISSGAADGGALPRVDGLHLQDGQSRSPANRGERYDPGEPKLNGALVRWDPRLFPLKIWISDGKMLPAVPFDQMESDRVPRVYAMLHNPQSIADLPQAAGWTPVVDDWVAEGFEKWRFIQDWFGKVCYGFVDDPTKADVLVFFNDGFVGSEGPGGTSVRGQTYGQVFTAQQVARKTRLGQDTMPIVIELKCPFAMPRTPGDAPEKTMPQPNSEAERIIGDAAHEFGHALGIKAHSPYYDDLMYVNRVSTLAPTAGDIATLRWLYSQTPAYWYYKQVPPLAVAPNNAAH